MEDYVLEDLQCKGLMIYQSRSGYRFTSDSVALANYVKVKPNGVLVDLCSGSGVIGILANAKNRIRHVYLVELQDGLAKACAKTIVYNHLENVSLIHNRAQNVHKVLSGVGVDTVVCNPPYYTKDQKSRTRSVEQTVARHEIEITLEEVVIEASKILKDGGKFYICIKENRLADLIYLARKYKLEPKELKILQEAKSDHVVLIKCIKGGVAGLKIV